MTPIAARNRNWYYDVDTALLITDRSCIGECCYDDQITHELNKANILYIEQTNKQTHNVHAYNVLFLILSQLSAYDRK